MWCLSVFVRAQAPTLPSSSIQQIREARLQPLKVALQDAIAMHTKATGVREALEAEVGGGGGVGGVGGMEESEQLSSSRGKWAARLRCVGRILSRRGVSLQPTVTFPIP